MQSADELQRLLNHQGGCAHLRSLALTSQPSDTSWCCYLHLHVQHKNTHFSVVVAGVATFAISTNVIIYENLSFVVVIV